MEPNELNSCSSLQKKGVHIHMLLKYHKFIIHVSWLDRMHSSHENVYEIKKTINITMSLSNQRKKKVKWYFFRIKRRLEDWTHKGEKVWNIIQWIYSKSLLWIRLINIELKNREKRDMTRNLHEPAADVWSECSTSTRRRQQRVTCFIVILSSM